MYNNMYAMFRSWRGSLYRKLIIVCLVLIIIISFCVSKKEVEGYDDDDDNNKVGFIITRHVNSAASNKVWKMCINQLRKYYKHEKIIIIDDNSNYDFITDDDDVDLTNCKIINSEFKKRGELLPYYYFYKNKQWFRRAVFIHDSVFINNKIDKLTEEISDVKFLWHFNGGQGENVENVERVLNVLTNHESRRLIPKFRDKPSWKGCWGVMSIIEYDFLKIIFEKYEMTRLLDHVQTREDRMAMERVFAIICIVEKPDLMDGDNASIFGHCDKRKNNRYSDTYTYDEYVEDLENNNMTCDINKIFLGR